MNKKLLVALFFLLGAVACIKSYAQTNTEAKIPTYKVAFFAPLYLDSIFNEVGMLKYKQSIPKFVAPGLEFIQGVQIALDTMRLLDANIEAYIYDSKSVSKPLPSLIQTKALDSINLIIGSVKDVDLKQLADFALHKKIPFISATYPNDGGITDNPFYAIANSTLRSHCEAIYSFVFQNHGGDKVYLCRKKGPQEDKVAAYFKNMNEQEGKPLMNIETINLDSTITTELLMRKMDSSRQIIIIGGSLNENFANDLVKACYHLPKGYSVMLIGMPNWDSFNALYKKGAFTDFPIYFTSPYFNNGWDNYSKMIKTVFAKKYKGKPTDMVYKGFESVFTFAKLLTKFPTDFMDHINDGSFKIFTDFNFKPIYLNKGKKPDYFENKHLYFIQLLNGNLSISW